jgi:hypothetical protein
VRFRHLRRSILRPSVQRYREGTVSRYVGTEGVVMCTSVKLVRGQTSNRRLITW